MKSEWVKERQRYVCKISSEDLKKEKQTITLESHSPIELITNKKNK